MCYYIQWKRFDLISFIIYLFFRGEKMNAKSVNMMEADVLTIKNNIRYTRTKEKIQIKENDKEKELKILEYNQKKYIFNLIENIIKRFVDILAGIVGVIILIPLTIMIFIANRIYNDKGPVFYTQERTGKDGKIFKIIKYRSMVVGADEKLKKYLDENLDAKQEYEKYKKLKNDPRITMVGKVLRKTSLDELPQLLNLLSRLNVISRTKTISTTRKNGYGTIL